MKVNHYYSVRSWNGQNKMSPLSDVVLYENTTGKDSAYYPKQLAVNDYFIQDSRYLKTYTKDSRRKGVSPTNAMKFTIRHTDPASAARVAVD